MGIFDLEGRRAIVTGAARGIGAAIARALARSGVSVAIADLDLAAAKVLAGEIGGGALASTLRAELRRMIEECNHGHVGECRVIGSLADHGQCQHEHG